MCLMSPSLTQSMPHLSRSEPYSHIYLTNPLHLGWAFKDVPPSNSERSVICFENHAYILCFLILHQWHLLLLVLTCTQGRGIKAARSINIRKHAILYTERIIEDNVYLQYCMPTDSPHLSKQLKPLAVAMSPVLWSRFKPDRFDSFSCGLHLSEIHLMLSTA